METPVIAWVNKALDRDPEHLLAPVGGAVTDITLGQGLIGRRDGGRFQLAVSPTHLERGRITDPVWLTRF